MPAAKQGQDTDTLKPLKQQLKSGPNVLVLASAICACRAAKRILIAGHSKSASNRQKPMKILLLLGFGGLP